MTLRFSEKGPVFPSALVDALLAGEVVFLCGTGISAPQLPDFQSLVDQTFLKLGIEMSASEQKAYNAQRFEEVLGAVSRRLADSDAMVRTASELLAVPEKPKIDQHRTVLRLSRDLSNRILTVTTNFDTLLERALPEVVPQADVRSLSVAGQALPAPGGAEFSGIIHIHGRLTDIELGLEATPLVLTSADYGDAYMRSGWASRFLFDLARCKTIVLIGYSANDAPVRYFLNVLEADRARFPDLRPVYAFDAYEQEPLDAEASWGTVAVTPLVYCRFNPDTGAPDHSPLWNDLKKLADIIDRPKHSRQQLARDILVQDSSAVDDRQIGELKWLFGDRSDLWPVAIDAISDPQWFRVFQSNALWSSKDAVWVVAAWIARNFEDRQRFATAVEWQAILGSAFVDELDQRFRHGPCAAPLWIKAWRLLLTVNPDQVGTFDQQAYAVQQKLQSGLVLDDDLRRAVALLTPALTLRRPFSSLFTEEEGEQGPAAANAPQRLSELAYVDLTVAEEYNAGELVSALNALDGSACRILELASQALRSSLEEAVGLGLIQDDYDLSDHSVPSIEDHEQNEHHDGVRFLVQAIVNAFDKAVAVDRERVRLLAHEWLGWPGRIGSRLALHVARNMGAFSSDEGLQIILELGDADFWIIRRELALLLRDRAADCNRELIGALEERILTSGEKFYSRYSIEKEQVDWRPHAIDAEVWLRLTMLKAAGAISQAGLEALAMITERRAYLDRGVEDRDFFTSYSSGVRYVVGDAAAILEAEPDERLEVAVSLSQSSDMNRQLGWRAYCRSDPQGAFATLTAADFTPPNMVLWNDFLGSLTFLDESEQPLRHEIAVEAMTVLERLEEDALRPIASSTIDLLMTGPRRKIASLEDWCDRLWAAVRQDEREVNFEDLHGAAINTAPGRLAQVLFDEFAFSRTSGGPEEVRQRDRMTRVADDEAPAGSYARAIFVHELGYLAAAHGDLVAAQLVPRLSGDDHEGRGLRDVLIRYTSITPEVSWLIPGVILQSVTEAKADTSAGAAIASRILRPALAALRGDEPDRWGISEVDVARTLRDAPAKVRTGTLNVLVRWMHADKAGAEEAWGKTVEPFFDRVWPKERRFLDDEFNRDLMSLAVGAGTVFPRALDKLRPYFSPFARERASVHPIKQSNAPEEFPRQVLELLWLIFGTNGATSYDMGDVLDRVLKADPTLEVDRRYQSLEQRTVRYR